MLPEIAKDGEHTPNKYLKERFDEYGVDVYTSTQVMEICDDCVIAQKDGETVVFSDVDMVVMAVGVKKELPAERIFDSYDGEVLYTVMRDP